MAFYDLFRNQKAMLPKDIPAVNPKVPSAFGFPREIYQRTGRRLEFLKFRMDNRQDFVRRTSIDSARKHKLVPALIGKIRCPEIRSQTCRLGGRVKQELNVKVQMIRRSIVATIFSSAIDK